MAQLASARLSERDLPGSIVGDFPLIRVAIAVNIRKTEHLQKEGGKGLPLIPVS